MLFTQSCSENFNEYFYVYPCNSGFFLILKALHISAFELLEYLNVHGIGISTLNSSHIRICFSLVYIKNLDRLFVALLNTAKIFSTA